MMSHGLFYRCPYYISWPWTCQLHCCLWRVRKLSDFTKNIWICVLKMNECLWVWNDMSWVINGRNDIFGWTIHLSGLTLHFILQDYLHKRCLLLPFIICFILANLETGSLFSCYLIHQCFMFHTSENYTLALLRELSIHKNPTIVSRASKTLSALFSSPFLNILCFCHWYS